MKRKGLKLKGSSRSKGSSLEDFDSSILNLRSSRSFIAEEVSNFYRDMYGLDEEGKGSGMKKEAQFFGGVGPVGSGAPVTITVPQPYIPELATPDRLFFPTKPKEAMKYWRYFYALDPVCGNVLDMYGEVTSSDITLSGFEIAGDDLSAEIRDTCYEALKDTNAVGQFKWMVIGYLVDGEVIPHLVWDNDLHRWVYLGFQDPMNVNVVDVPFVRGLPYLELEISDSIRNIFRNPDPIYERFRKQVPNEFLDLILQGRNIPLKTDENVTFIPRRLTPYDIRGISIFARIWRVLIYEDAIMNASIQTARRHAAPVKVVKLGDPSRGWIPGPEQEDKIKRLLAIAETDPHAWLVTHFGVSFEAWGTTDRVMSISREWDTIERIKLIALGVSRAFLHGEVTYSSAEKGLQIFLSRLKGLRTFFEQVWWYPRFFGIMSQKNEWVAPTRAELSHNVRVRRSKKELLEDGRYIIPRIVWEENLEPQDRSELIRIYTDLVERLGIKISRGTVLANLGLDFEEEEKNWREEQKVIEDLDKEYGKKETVPGQSPMGVPMGVPMDLGIPEVSPAGVGVPMGGEVPAESPETGIGEEMGEVSEESLEGIGNK